MFFYTYNVSSDTIKLYNINVKGNISMIEIKNVSKTYNGTKKALDNVNLKINSGEIFAFIGHNGAGKTTLLRMIAGIIFIIIIISIIIIFFL